MEKKLPLTTNTSAQSDAVQLSTPAQATAAQLACDDARENDRARSRQGREQTNRSRRESPKEHSAQSNEQDRQRRKIDITKSEMLPAGHVIELVAKITVTAVRKQMEE